MWQNRGYVLKNGNTPNNNSQQGVPGVSFSDPDKADRVLVPMSSMEAQQFHRSRSGQHYNNFQAPTGVSNDLIVQQSQTAPKALAHVSSTVSHVLFSTQRACFTISRFISFVY